MKYKINFNREKLSPEEMNKRMNFEEFINGAPAPAGMLSKITGTVKWAALAGVAGLVAVAAYLFAGDGKEMTEQTSFINPPIEGVNIRYSNFDIDVSHDTTLIYETGSTINIPAGAFIDKHGKLITGDVEIRYREFHDPFEILLSGIPMHYDSAGTHYTFESAGMFELLAFRNNEPLSIIPGKELTVNLISLNADNDFNMYYLDTVQKQWEYLGRSSADNGNNKVLYDSLLASEYAERMLGIDEPPVITVSDPNKQNFIIDYNKEEFPELAVFDGVKFQVDDSDQSYDPSLANQIWEDVIVKRADKKYTVTFSRAKSSYTFKVVPVVDEKDYPKFRQELDRKMAEYTIAVNDKNQKEKNRQAILQANFEKYNSEARWENVQARINETLKRNPINYPGLAMRTFGITMPGVYNTDRPRTFLSQPRFVYGQMYHKGKPVNTHSVYLLIKGANIVYSYICHDNEVEIQFGKDDPNFIVATTKEGKLAYMNTDEFRQAVSSKERAKLEMKVHPKKIETVEEFKALLNMN